MSDDRLLIICRECREGIKLASLYVDGSAGKMQDPVALQGFLTRHIQECHACRIHGPAPGFFLANESWPGTPIPAEDEGVR